MRRGRRRRPKTAELLARPEAAGVVAELRLARRLQVAPTVLRGRRLEVTNLYDDPENPDRVTSVLHSPAWTADDRSLLMALQTYEDTLCPGCGQPKTLAWHDFSQPTWEHTEFVCHGCTAMAAGQERTYTNAHSTATDEDRAGWPEFAFGETTTDPKPPENG